MIDQNKYELNHFLWRYFNQEMKHLLKVKGTLSQNFFFLLDFNL